MIEEFYRVVPDYPKPGVNFIDINSLFASPAWNTVTAIMAQKHRETFRHTTQKKLAKILIKSDTVDNMSDPLYTFD